MDLPKHSYEELREIIVEILLGRVSVHYEVNQWGVLLMGVAEVLTRGSGTASTPAYPPARITSVRLEVK
jgi:hypothetical protein